MKRKKNMCDFVYGGCEVVKEPEKFIAMWLNANGNPCSVCGEDKSKCSFYRKLIENGVIAEKENPP